MNCVKTGFFIGIAFVWLSSVSLFPMEEEISVNQTQPPLEETITNLPEVSDGLSVEFSSCEKIMAWTGRIGLFVGTTGCSVGTIMGASYCIPDVVLSMVLGITGGVVVSLAGVASQVSYEYYLDKILINRKKALHFVIEGDENV